MLQADGARCCRVQIVWCVQIVAYSSFFCRTESLAYRVFTVTTPFCRCRACTFPPSPPKQGGWGSVNSIRLTRGSDSSQALPANKPKQAPETLVWWQASYRGRSKRHLSSCLFVLQPTSPPAGWKLTPKPIWPYPTPASLSPETVPVYRPWQNSCSANVQHVSGLHSQENGHKGINITVFKKTRPPPRTKSTEARPMD